MRSTKEVAGSALGGVCVRRASVTLGGFDRSRQPVSVTGADCAAVFGSGDGCGAATFGGVVGGVCAAAGDPVKSNVTAKNPPARQSCPFMVIDLIWEPILKARAAVLCAAPWRYGD